MSDRRPARVRRERAGRALLVAGVVIGMLAAGGVNLWELWRAFTTGCVATRYGSDCWSGEPWGYAVTVALRCFACFCAFGVSAFATWLTWRQDQAD